MLGLFVILGVGGIALLTGRREAEERPSPEPDGPPDEPPSPAFVRRAASMGASEAEADAGRPRARAPWEVYSSLDNQPLGTLDEHLTQEEANGGEPSPIAESGQFPPETDREEDNEGADEAGSAAAALTSDSPVGETDQDEVVDR